MTKGIKFLLLVSILSSYINAQFRPGARQAALSFSDLTSPEEVFSNFYNPSVLVDINKTAIGFSYSPAPFGLKELSTAYLSFVYPSKIGTFGAGIMVYGFELYKETQLLFSYSTYLTEKFSIGISSIYKNLSIRNYGSNGFVLLNIGCTITFTKEFRLGFLIENFTRTTIKEESNQFPIVLSTGINFKPVEKIILFLAMNKELNYDFSFRGGIEYNLVEFLSLRIGTTNQQDQFSGGIGLNYNFITFDYAVISHLDLGLTHHFSIIINL